MTVWDDLVGQEQVVGELGRAVEAAAGALGSAAGAAMAHAWLLTGPPGSGRSTAARAFAAALQCDAGGCGHCPACRTALAGTSADVELVSTALLSHGVKDMRALVQRAARHPVGGRWQVILLEDADRLTEQAANALLKSIEEPPARTVWLLCAPTVDDVLATLRSRCRTLSLRTPSSAAVAEVLVRRDGIDPAMAAFAARAAQGHIGRARRLARDEQARLRRAAALRVPTMLGGLSSCLEAAAELVEAASEEAKQTAEELDVREGEELRRALGGGTQGRGLPTGAAAQLKELERTQKTRAKRVQRDALDRALVDLASYYRDVLCLQLGASTELTNEEMRPQLQKAAASSTPEQTLRRVDAVLACRTAIESNVAPLLAAEAMAVALR
ncbi:MAG: DNA polymerase III subunit delta' [Actinomycetota bacterium]|nr:DNA polymerase III subunit delta' [Actinomycetota bacterium]